MTRQVWEESTLPSGESKEAKGTNSKKRKRKLAQSHVHQPAKDFEASDHGENHQQTINLPNRSVDTKDFAENINDSPNISATVVANRGPGDPPQKAKKSKRSKPDSKHEKERSTVAERGPEEIGTAAVRDDSLEHEDVNHRSIRAKFAKLKEAKEKLSETEPSREQELDGQVFEEKLELIEAQGLRRLPQPEDEPDTPKTIDILALPDWLAKPLTVSPSATLSFEDLALDRAICKTLKKHGYTHAFAIQVKVLSLLLRGENQHPGDLCISAATGSGKTLAYVLPMVDALRNKPVTKLRGIVIVPTRELVSQVQATFQLCIAGTGLQVGVAVGSKTLREERNILLKKSYKLDFRSLASVGGDKISETNDDPWASDSTDSEPEPEMKAEYHSNVDILICTPGRLVHHIRSTKGFSVSSVQWLVVDEADRLIDQSFQEWIDVVLPALHKTEVLPPFVEFMRYAPPQPSERPVRKVVLSATMTKDLSKLAALRLSDPRLVALGDPEARKVSHAIHKALGDQDDNSEMTFELPQTLSESAISVREIGDKPLQLVKLLENLSDFKATQTTRKINGYATRTGNTPATEGTSTSGYSETSSDEDDDHNETNADQTIPNQQQKNTFGTLVFTSTNENAHRLARLITILRPSWTGTTKTLTKSTATSSGRKILAAFHKRKISILIASDRASRGLDIQDLAHVVNYDMPNGVTAYVHRVGRTARAGKAGTATTLVAHHEARWFWNEIARSEQIWRNSRRKVSRADAQVQEISETERRAYDDALEKLGREAKGWN